MDGYYAIDYELVKLAMVGRPVAATSPGARRRQWSTGKDECNGLVTFNWHAGEAVKGRAALVTGGSSGIGHAIAGMLGRAGYGLTISGRRADKLEIAAEELISERLNVFAHSADMRDREQVVAMIAAHRERFGRLDVLVNNAGVGTLGYIDDVSDEDVDATLEANLRGLILATREAIPLLRAAGAEHRKALVVNVASYAGKVGQPRASIYSATKAGVVGFSQAIQSELDGEGVQVTALCPAFVDTPMTDYIKDEVPREEMIRPEDIAESIRFLLGTSPACLVPEIVFTRPGAAAQAV